MAKIQVHSIKRHFKEELPRTTHFIFSNLNRHFVAFQKVLIIFVPLKKQGKWSAEAQLKMLFRNITFNIGICLMVMKIVMPVYLFSKLRHVNQRDEVRFRW